MREMSNNLCNFIHGKPQCKKRGQNIKQIFFSRKYESLKTHVYQEFVQLRSDYMVRHRKK